MKRNGFTLIELLAVITIIGVVSLITMPVVQKNINNSKKQAYETQISTIKKAAKDWSSENLSYLPDQDGDSIKITLYTLMSLGYIEEDLVDPLTDKYFDTETIITITKNNNNYKYEVNVVFSDEKLFVDHDAPVLFLKGDYITYVEINDINGYEEPGIDSNVEGLSYNTYYYEITDTNENEVATIDTTKLGKYKVKYYASNSGKQSSITRYIIVRDTIAPTITVPITETISSSVVSGYNLMSGVSVTDNSDETIIPEITGQLSTIPGSYIITYTATDSSGNRRIKKRTIIVK